jgi:hypothetical protein
MKMLVQFVLVLGLLVDASQALASGLPNAIGFHPYPRTRTEQLNLGGHLYFATTQQSIGLFVRQVSAVHPISGVLTPIKEYQFTLRSWGGQEVHILIYREFLNHPRPNVIYDVVLPLVTTMNKIENSSGRNVSLFIHCASPAQRWTGTPSYNYYYLSNIDPPPSNSQENCRFLDVSVN